ncbi:MAG: SRPBCC domain-containing protein [Bacteroidia bacterium]|nr:SRPBCC domain-containing protein [Bacteroidia bacterium]
MKALVKEYEIFAPKKRVFDALTQLDLIVAWSGDEVEMDLTPGGDFSLWGGSVYGVNLEVSPDRIVQKWQEENWDKPSKVIFTLKEDGNKTILHVLHNGIPDKSFYTISLHWDEDYLLPLKTLVENMGDN